MTEFRHTIPIIPFIAPKDLALLLLGLVSLAAYVTIQAFSSRAGTQTTDVARNASAMMERATAAVREDFVSHGGHFNDAIDPNHTGLIGEEYSDITSTVGSLEAKRTTTNPNAAAMLVQLLQEAGVAAGDTIAVGCSGSFPALAIATVSAAKSFGVHPVLILSIGASSFGATRPDQTLLDLYEALRQTSDLKVPVAAVSLGGAKDVGSDFEPDVREKLIEKIRHSGIPFLYESDLRKNVAQRMQIYFGTSSKRRIAAFVNIGGSYADLGTNPLILKVEPGVNKEMTIPADETTHGVVFAMAKQHIPVIHLLHIKELALRYGLPWDPIPLPIISSRSLQSGSGALRTTWAVTGAYFVSVILIVVYYRKVFFRKYS
ncbi:MAG: poly-gamma-glutamate system protein [Bacteroidota bacterium]